MQPAVVDECGPPADLRDLHAMMLKSMKRIWPWVDVTADDLMIQGVTGVDDDEYRQRGRSAQDPILVILRRPASRGTDPEWDTEPICADADAEKEKKKEE
ncbi:unnamed protein product [Vitrella brassicaformis CCMP3155]|uniref:Uncharacterized protein n=1 Tax=Vitrella brassicaformis (strain CCMP3155) TaxID=1169540 RepID=A0A0G4FY62_VITBC|nr:unnamed protein product [Vitrella brassicaformis CCMP3155]|eukprot:CEM20371.1 unnamed protein product [Vitrella brassicaformis CCMP3155]